MSNCSFVATDLEASVTLLHQGFRTWHRIQHEGLATRERIEVYRQQCMHESYGGPGIWGFQPLFRKNVTSGLGETKSPSILLGEGRYARVYGDGRYAYKVVNIPPASSPDRYAELRMCVRETCFYHGPEHPRILGAKRSQLIMSHGRIIRMIHQLPRAQRTLRDQIMAKEITCWPEILNIVRDVLVALRDMHRQGLLHGDLKPSNVLLMDNHRALLADFSLTMFEGRGVDYSLGSLYWRAPECMLGHPSTQASDVWSLGMLMMDCLYGCEYAREVWRVEDNRHGLRVLVHVLGTPPGQVGLSRFMETPEETKMDPGDAAALRARIDRARATISATDDELGAIQDLLRRTLQWDPEKRSTAKDLVDRVHHLLGERVPPQVNCLHESTPAWKYEMEFQRITDLASQELEAQVRFEMDAAQIDWLMKQVVEGSGRLIRKLQDRGITYATQDVVRMYCTFYMFIWAGQVPEDTQTMFESELYHILCLDDFSCIRAYRIETIGPRSRDRVGRARKEKIS